MRREDYKIGGKGWIITGDSSIPYQPRIVKIILTEYAMFGGFVARDKDEHIHIVRDSQDVFCSAKEACDWLETACEKAIEEAVDAESEVDDENV